MRSDLEFWKAVRREVLTNEWSQRAACRKYGLGWHTLKKILAHAEPPGYRPRQPPKKRKLGTFLPIIEQILESDRQAPKKPRHTVRRIYERRRNEQGDSGGLTMVSLAVREWRQSRKEVFLPLSHPPGEAQVDYGEAKIQLNGQETSVALFVMTRPYSGAIFVQAFPRECTETFLEGHRRAFEFLGGVPKRISYDNLAIVVIEVLKGRERKLTKEFLRLQSHYLFREHFCLVRRANEKGNVERLLGFARRSFLVPVPEVDSLETLNRQLLERCQQDLEQRTRGKTASKRELLAEDQAAFLPLPKQTFESRRIRDGTADSQSLVRFDTNDDSVPVQYAHRKRLVIATVEEVRLVFEDRLAAWHRRNRCGQPAHDRRTSQRSARPTVCVGRPTALGSRPRRDHPSLRLSGSAEGGDAMTPTDTKSTVLLKHHLKALKLPTMTAECEKIAQRCAADNADHLAFLLQLCELELLERERKAAERRLKGARFPATKLLDEFDFTARPSVNKPLVLELLKGEYLDRRENILLVGPSGTGKTHLATALGMSACSQGRQVRFFRVTELITPLMEAKEERHLLRLRQQLGKRNLLILDELGYVPASKAGAELLFDVIATAYEPNRLIVTTNLSFENWTEVLGNERLTGAALDRLTHRCHILETKGECYRLQDAKRRRHRHDGSAT